MKNRYGSRNFRYKGYFVDIVGKNAKVIKVYIRSQLEDLVNDQISLKEYMDPFAGSERGNRQKKTAVHSGCL